MFQSRGVAGAAGSGGGATGATGARATTTIAGRTSRSLRWKPRTTS